MLEMFLLQTADEDFTWQEASIAVAGVVMITVIVAVAIWQVLASWRARMSVAREDAYRRLAEDSAATQQRLVDQQQAIASDLANLRQSVQGIEKLLEQVE